MSKEEFVTYMIQHEADYPLTRPITLESAQRLIDYAVPDMLPPDLTASEVVTIWNRLIQDESVMAPDHPITG